MALECELKYLDVNLKEIGRVLHEKGGTTSGPYFESNLVFDYPDRSLKRLGTLLRLREKRGRAVLTVKTLPEKPASSSLKVLEETETEVGDFNCMKKMLVDVGFSVAFGYEKVREKWLFKGCVVCLDRLPFGDYVEIEGEEEAVLACALDLGLDSSKSTTLTYHDLNIEYLSKNGMKPEASFLFSADERRSIQGQLRKD